MFEFLAPISAVYSVIEPYIDPLIRLGQWVYGLTVVSVIVNVENASDLVVMNMAHFTITGACTHPGQGSTLRKGDMYTYQFCGATGRPVSSGYIVFEVRRNDNKQHIDN